MMEIITSTWAQVLSIFLSFIVAYFKGRRVVLWGFLAYFFGPISLVVLICRSTLPRKEYGWLLWLQRKAASRAIEKKFGEIETTEDFLKEIENDKNDEK